MSKNQKHPADIFIDCYMPGASDIEREKARENMVQFVAVLMRINERLTHEDDKPDSPKPDSCDRFQEAP